ncbi:protoporphyrinogen oxidase-like [Babylonia areolata]|uniref:protoporphyrinogen oxidase-like n=1 Tax=Babylonia areolata TaxID=304850 RepID=UPI003FD4F512
MATVVVLGGGVSGLAAAYYLQRQAASIGKIILLEGSKRVGGWMQSVKHSDGSVFEFGPRSLRPVGPSGRNTLHLAEELGLTQDILVVRRSDAAAKKRFLYTGGRLCALPSSVGGVLKTVPPFSRPLLLNFLGEPFAKRNTAQDETIHSFVGRRLGAEFADIAVDAMCRGIFANDCRKLSMKSCFPDIFRMERQHGSLTAAMFKARGSAPPQPSALEKRAKEEKWASWSLRHGLQQLSDAMETAVMTSPLCEVRKGSPCHALTPTPDGKIKVKTEGEEILADRVLSAVYSKDLAALLPDSMKDLQRDLMSIPSVSVYVVNLEYPGYQLPFEGFGHLLPSSESPYILGVVYDSCTFPAHDRPDCPSTRLTVMLGGGWLDQMRTGTGDLPEDSEVAAIAQQAVCQQLGVASDLQPSKVNVVYQKECIPAYTLGHADRLVAMDTAIRGGGLPLHLVGSSYRGVSVNDCINNARLEVEGLVPRL